MELADIEGWIEADKIVDETRELAVVDRIDDDVELDVDRVLDVVLEAWWCVGNLVVCQHEAFAHVSNVIC